MLGQVIATVGIPVLVDIIGRVLSGINNPVAKGAGDALGQLKGTLASGAITAEQMAEANRHAEELAKLDYEEYERTLLETNQTLRAEMSSEDVYVRRMRPTFGYLMAVSWAAQMLGLTYIVVFETEKSAAVLEGMAALSTMWAVALSVLGVYIYRRSEEKKVTPSSLLDNITLPKIKPAIKPRGLNQ